MAALPQSPAKSRYSEVKLIGSCMNISIPVASSLAAGGVVTNTIQMSRVGQGTNVLVTLQTPTNGVIVDAYGSAAGVITIRQTNVTPSTISTVAASLAQVKTFSSD